MNILTPPENSSNEELYEWASVITEQLNLILSQIEERNRNGNNKA